MANERKTENIVRKLLKDNDYYQKEYVVEEQISDNPKIIKLLKTASKSGFGVGKPEFLISKHDSDTIIIIECKSNILKHISKELDNPKDYAVDGVLLYGSFLSKSYNCICVAVSGETISNLKISNYFFIKGSKSPEPLNINTIVSFQNYENVINNTKSKIDFDFKTITKSTIKLHNLLREKMKVTDELKPIIISAILLALSDKSFYESYNYCKTPKNLFNQMMTAIENKLSSIEGLSKDKITIMLDNFKTLNLNSRISSTKDRKDKNNSFFEAIDIVKEDILPFLNVEHTFDYIGGFYKEFLRYTDGNKKGLGIVLTPTHITELFCELANLSVNDIVLDPACGTGGFLISAMNFMLKQTDNDKIKAKINKDQLIGIESEAKLFTLSATNMIIRGDGKANLYNKDCFDVVDIIRNNHHPNIGFINPPYSQSEEGGKELDFINNMLNMLEINGIGIGIIPINCVCSKNKTEVELRKKLLKNHTLISVMSMPTNLFYPVGTVTCIIVFKAHKPHDYNQQVWFGYWRDDGFIVSRNTGRIDKHNKWEIIKKKWIDMFKNRKIVDNISVLKNVSAEDEWCAEAYLLPDYSKINEDLFNNSLKEYLLFKSLYENKKSNSDHFEID